jgi:hypothetical protein
VDCPFGELTLCLTWLIGLVQSISSLLGQNALNNNHPLKYKYPLPQQNYICYCIYEITKIFKQPKHVLVNL